MPGSGQAPTWAPCSRAWPPHPPWHHSLPTPPSEATELVAAFLFCLLHQLTWLVHCALNLPSDSRHFSLCGFFPFLPLPFLDSCLSFAFPPVQGWKPCGVASRPTCVLWPHMPPWHCTSQEHAGRLPCGGLERVRNQSVHVAQRRAAPVSPLSARLTRRRLGPGVSHPSAGGNSPIWSEHVLILCQLSRCLSGPGSCGGHVGCVQTSLQASHLVHGPRRAHVTAVPLGQ